MKYTVTAFNIEAQQHTTIGIYATELEAQIAIEDAVDEDIENGDYERYDYYINGEIAA